MASKQIKGKSKGAAVPSMSAEKRALLAEFGIEPSNGRKGRTFGPNKLGLECIATVSKAVGAKQGSLAIVPTKDVTEGSLPTVPKGTAAVRVNLTRAQVERWASEWATQNGRKHVAYRGIVLVK